MSGVPYKVKAKAADGVTLETFREALPKHMRKNLSQEMVDTINNLAIDPIFAENYRENLLGYASVLKEGKYNIPNYLNAVKYVSYKLMGSTNVAAYAKTFPERYQRLLDIGSEQKYISGIVSSYNQNKLVTLVFEQSIMPVHIINADLHQKAINHLAYLMLNARSEKVQSDSAAKLTDILKIPEVQKVELDIGIREDKTLEELRNTTLELVKQQKLMIESGANSVKEVAHSKLLIEDGQVVE